MKRTCNRYSAKAFAAIAAACCLPVVSSFGLVLNVPQKYQEKDQWCWAGTSQAVLAYYGASVTQSNIAQYGTGGANAPNFLYGSGTDTDGIFKHGADLILSNFAGIVSIGTNNLLSVERVRNEIETNRRPVVIRWGWDSGSNGHILAMYGILVTNRPTRITNVWLMDPFSGPTISTYAWVCQGSTNGGSTHTWTHSLPLNTAPPSRSRRDCWISEWLRLGPRPPKYAPSKTSGAAGRTARRRWPRCLVSSAAVRTAFTASRLWRCSSATAPPHPAQTWPRSSLLTGSL